MSKQPSQHIKLFDGLKGLSIIAIIIYYLFQYALPGGYLAVNLFLFIAGFFNIRHFYLADLRGQKVKTWQFYKRRLNRLFFPMLAMILIAGAITMLFARGLFFNMREMGLSSLLFVNNYYQIINKQSYFEQAANPSIYIHLWYVSLYAQLVLITPWLMNLFYRWNRRSDVAINIFLVTSFISMILMTYWYLGSDGDPSRVYYDLLTRMFAFTLGGAAGLFLPENLITTKRLNTRQEIILNVVSTLMMVLMLLMVKFMYGTQAFAYKYGMALFTIIGTIFVLFSIYPNNWWNRLLSTQPIVAIGQRSYSYYLWFYPIYLLVPEILPILNKNLFLNTLIQVILIIGIGEVSYQLFEQRKWSLPIGQDFNFRKARYQWRYLMNHPQELKGIKAATVAYAIFAVIGGIAILAAPKERGNVAQELQEVIEQNQEIIKETQEQETSERPPINYIEGLDQQVALHANVLEVTFIGDSILLSSAEQLKKVFPNATVDGSIGRQLYESAEIIEDLEAAELLEPTVVTLLGSNGTFNRSQLEDYIEAVGPDRELFFVNLNVDRPWAQDVNQRLQQAADKYGNIKLIDWLEFSTDHSQWFYDDQVHPNEEGSLELAKFIAEEVYRQR